jgi:hypothetical protein
VRDQVSHPYSTTGKITVLYILIFKFFIWDGKTDFTFSLIYDISDFHSPIRLHGVVLN